MQHKKSTHIIQNIIRYSLTAVLGVLFICFLSLLFSNCALLLSASLYIFISAAFFGVSSDINMAFANINQALKKIFSPNYLRNGILENYLLAEDKAKNDCKFSNLYKKLSKELKLLHKKAHILKHYDPHNELKETKLEIKKCERQLHRMLHYFKVFIYNKDNTNPYENNPVYQDLKQHYSDDDREQIKKIIRNKIRLHRAITFPNFIAQIGLGLFATAAVKNSLLFVANYFSFAIPVLALSSTVFGLAIVAAIMYFMYTYNAIIDMLKKDTFNKIYEHFKEKILSHNQKDSHYYWRFSLFIFLTALVIFATVVATIATGGTWWRLANASTGIVPYIGKFINWIRLVVIPLIAATIFAFNLNNSLNTINDFRENFSLDKFIKKIKKAFTADPEKNIWQSLNFFQAIVWVISNIFNTVCFILHIVSVAFTGDGMGKAFIFPNLLNETLVDWEYILGNGDHDDHGHSHFNILAVVLFIVLNVTLLVPLAALWNYAFSRLNSEPEKRLTFGAAYKQVFGKSAHANEIKLEKIESKLSSCKSDTKSKENQKQIESLAALDINYRLNKRKEKNIISDKLLQLKEDLISGDKYYDAQEQKYNFTFFQKQNPNVELSDNEIKLAKEFFEIRNDIAYPTSALAMGASCA